MKQLTQQLKSGNMDILEVPFPILDEGKILVRNYYSVISAGTEGKTVGDARKGYIAKAKSRKKEVREVIDMIKTTGFKETYQLVMNKLEAPAELGYSCAGEVIALGEGVKDFRVGDFVAGGGANAVHADVVSIPINLAVKVSNIKLLEASSFSTIASIAIQGIRQGELQVGSNCVVIGLGLIGQLAMQILQASGIKAIGIDISKDQVKLAKKGGCQFAYTRDQDGLNDIIDNITNGAGADAILIAAGTSSLDPVEFAGEIARKKAKVVIVGAVPTGFSRANYYRKELDLRMSSSYGPGRYDSSYEEKGIDYPIGYVRFTEKRNMQTFVDLLESGKLNIDYLITHRFKLEDAPSAYEMILDKTEPFAGIVLNYDVNLNLRREVKFSIEQQLNKELPKVGFVGAGNFAQNMLLPRMKGLCYFQAIATSKGNESVYVAKKYNFNNSYESGDKIFSDTEVNTVFIVTRHDTHAKFVKLGIRNGKHVFSEKPLCLTENELEEINSLYQNSNVKKFLMLGFNRRFSRAIKKIKNSLTDEQTKAINIRINAGKLPSDHWVNDIEVGGGRLIGEACHFIDLAMHLAGSRPINVHAVEMKDPNGLQNTITINIKYENGSIANISYFSNGSKKLPKEYIEVFSGGTTFLVDDFRSLTTFNNSIKKEKYKGQDKGHAEELKEFFIAIKNGKPCPIPYNESYLSMKTTFKVIESLNENRVIPI